MFESRVITFTWECIACGRRGKVTWDFRPCRLWREVGRVIDVTREQTRQEHERDNDCVEGMTAMVVVETSDSDAMRLLLK